MTKDILQFDPDKFVLTKQDFLRILDKIRQRWSKNKNANWKLIAELEGAKFYFRLKSDESIRLLWGEIVKEINEIMIDNSIKVSEINDEKNLEIFKKIRDGKENF